MIIAHRLPHVVRVSSPFGCFQNGLGADRYMSPPLDTETGIPVYPLEQWRTLDKKMRKALTKEQEQYNAARLKYLKQVKTEEKKEAKILGKQLEQTERVTAIEAVQSGATQSVFGGDIMAILPFIGAGVLLLFLLRRRKS